MLNQHVQTLYSMCSYLDKRYRLFNPCFSRVSPCYYCTTQPLNLNVQISVELLCLPTFSIRYPGEMAGFHIKHGQSLKKKKRSVYIQVILVSPVYLTAIRKMPDCRRLCWESAKIGAATIMIFVTFTRIWRDGSDAEALGFTRSQLQQHCSATTVMLHRVVLRSVHTRMCMNIIGSNHLISFFKIINKILTAQRNH